MKSRSIRPSLLTCILTLTLFLLFNSPPSIMAQRGDPNIGSTIPVPARIFAAYSSAIRDRPHDVLPGKNILITSLDMKDGWAISTVALKPTIQDDGESILANSTLIIAYQNGFEWVGAIMGSIQYEDSLSRAPSSLVRENAKPYLRSPKFSGPASQEGIGTSLKWPWKQGITWVYTQGRHGTSNSAVDLAPYSNSPNGDRAILAAASGVVIRRCDDSIQSNVVVRHSTGGSNDDISGYLHIDKNTVSLGTGVGVSQGQTLGYTYNGSNWNDTCGYGTGPHLHFFTGIIPAGSNNSGSITLIDIAGTTVSGWNLGADNCFKKSGQSDRCVNATFTSDNGGSQPCSNSNAGSSEIVLFADQNYGGNCVRLGINDYSDAAQLSPVGNDDAESIKVGSNVKAILYENAGFGGISETFTSDDSNLNDNSIGSRTSSVKVQNRQQSSGQWHARYFSDYTWGSQKCERDFNGGGLVGADFSEDWGGGGPTNNCSGMPSDSFSVRYTGNFSFGSGTYWFHVNHDDGAKLIIDGQTLQDWSGSGEDCPAKSMNSGTHSLQIDYRENTGGAHISLEVRNSDCAHPLDAPTLIAPNNGAVFGRSDSIQFSWNGSSGANQYYAEMWGGPGGNTGYSTGWISSTSWTNPPAWGGSYQWHVKARNSTSQESGWSETRTLTIKYGVPSNLAATPASSSQINLSWSPSADAPGNIDGYRVYRNGSAIKTVGKDSTTYNDTALSCNTLYSYFVRAYKDSSESDSSNTATATTLQCQGTVDLTRIWTADGNGVEKATFKPGDSITYVYEIDNSTGVSQSASTLWIVADACGQRVIFNNDPISVLPGKKTYSTPRTIPTNLCSGTWGYQFNLIYNGDSQSAMFHFVVDGDNPTVTFINPVQNGYINTNQVDVQVSASDQTTSVKQVNFLAGYDDGTAWNWHDIGTDTNSSDGWHVTWNASGISDKKGAVAFWADAYDQAGNKGSDTIGNVNLDRTPPTSSVDSLPPTSPPTFPVSWQGSDALAGIATYDVQYKDGAAGAWTDWKNNVTETSDPFTGQGGHTYYFRSRAHDKAGNIEAWPSNADAQTLTESSPGTFNKTSPANGATGQPTNPTLSWGSSSGASSYEYCIDTTNDNACANNGWVDVGNITSKPVPELSSSTTYYWQVRARNASGTTDADNGAWWSFVTLSPVASIVIEDNDSRVTYKGTWSYATSAPKASGGTYHASSQVGATACVAVSGASGFRVTTITGANRGIANALVDGAQVGTFDGNSPTITYGVVMPPPDQNPFPIPDAGQHNICVRVSGNPAASVVVLDNFIVYQGGTPPPPCYTLTTVVNPSNGGTITRDLQPDCNNNTQYSAGTNVVLTPHANTNYSFTSWSGDATGTANPLTVTMSSNKSITANFSGGQSGTNLLPNPGFELDTDNNGIPDNWGTNTKFKRISKPVYEEKYAARLKATDNKGVSVGPKVLNLTPGRTYAASCMVRIPSTTDSFTFQIQIRWLNASNQLIGSAVPVSQKFSGATADWVLAAKDIVAPANTASAQFLLVATSLNAAINVDKCEFTPK